MKRTRFSDEQIIGILQEHEAGAKCADLCRKHGMSHGTFYAWKSKLSGMHCPAGDCLQSPRAGLQDCRGGSQNDPVSVLSSA